MTYRVTASVMVPGRDIACAALDAVHRWGRDGVDEQPDAGQLTVTVMDPAGTIADTVRPGDTITARIAVGDLPERPWFTGRVTDVDLERRDRETTIRAASMLARLGRVYIGDTPWPAESDGSRIARILSLAGIAPSWLDAPERYAPAPYWEFATGSWLDAAGDVIRAGAVTLLPRDVDRQPALSLLRDTAGAAGGVIYETRSGVIGYRDQTARTAEAGATVDACWLLGDATFTRTTEGLTNDVTVKYGPDPADAEQGRPSVHATDPDSIAAFGLWARTIDSVLADQSDAGALARRTVARRRFPRWVADTFRATSTIAPASVLDGILDWPLGLTVNVHNIGEPTPAASLLRIVEGSQERLDGHTLTVALSMSDVMLSLPASSWTVHGADDPGRRWNTVPAGVDWYAADTLIGQA